MEKIVTLPFENLRYATALKSIVSKGTNLKQNKKVSYRLIYGELHQEPHWTFPGCSLISETQSRSHDGSRFPQTLFANFHHLLISNMRSQMGRGTTKRTVLYNLPIKRSTVEIWGCSRLIVEFFISTQESNGAWYNDQFSSRVDDLWTKHTQWRDKNRILQKQTGGKCYEEKIIMIQKCNLLWEKQIQSFWT